MGWMQSPMKTDETATDNSFSTVFLRQVNRVKTAQTNRLKVETTRGRILARQAVRSSGDAGCTKFEPTRATVADAVAGGPYRRYCRSAANAGVSMEAAASTEIDEDQ